MHTIFKASIDTSLAHSLNTWGVGHQLITRIAAQDFVYATALLGIMWVVLNSLKEVKPFATGAYIKHLVIDGFFILVVPVGLTALVAKLVSQVRDRPRPSTSSANIQEIISHVTGSSFPSVHVALMAAVATAIYLRNRQAGNGIMWLTIICGIAKVAAGVHYPTDIIFGIFLGIVITVGTNRLLMRLMRL